MGNRTGTPNKFIARIKWHLKELNKTFSNQPSYYSSKRIERMIIFLNALIIFDIMMWWLLHKDKIDAMTAIATFVTQMGFCGWQTKQIFKEKTTDGGPGTKSEES